MEQSRKNIYSITKTKSVPLLQPGHGFCQQNGPEHGQVLVSEWKNSGRMADLVIQGAWVLYRINKDKGDESLPLVAFRRNFFWNIQRKADYPRAI